MPETKIFLSIGTTANKLHQQLADTVESYVKMNDLVPQTVGRTYFSSKQPLVAIKELMHECAGSIILAAAPCTLSAPQVVIRYSSGL